MALDKTTHLNGYKPKTFGDLLLSSGFILSGLVWGMKLESDNNRLMDDNIRLHQSISDLRVQVAVGILPRAEVRINYVEERLKELGDDFDDHDKEHRKIN